MNIKEALEYTKERIGTIRIEDAGNEHDREIIEEGLEYLKCVKKVLEKEINNE